MKNTQTQNGISLLEMLIAVSILGILLAVVISYFISFKNTQLLSTARDEVFSIVVKAKSETLSSKNSKAYGVHFENTKVVLFTGPTYIATATDNEAYIFNPKISLSSIVLSGGGSDMLFDRLTGFVTKNGSIVMSLVSDTTKQKSIMITKTGIISYN